MLLATSCMIDQEDSNSIDGVWRSIGYGKILSIKASEYAYYDVTQIFCLPVSEGTVSDFGDAIQVIHDTLIIFSGSSIYTYNRISSLPDMCSKKVEDNPNDPEYNFEVLSQTIKEHYAYLDLNKINWDSLYLSIKSKITPKSTDLELFLVMEEMINTINDNHGSIEPTDEVYELVKNIRPPILVKDELKEYGDFHIANLVTEHFLEQNMTKDSWLINWGKMKNNIGYIQVKAMWLYANLNLSDSLVQQNGFVNTYVDAFSKLNESHYVDLETQAVRLLMDDVMDDLKNTDCMILDVRFNGGGQDVVGMEILRRFNDETIQVATKRAKYNNGYAQKTPIYIDLSTNPYKKPVFLLTSQQSASATDFMALASLGMDNIKRIGSHTNGAISDALEKRLPNNWYFSISNLLYEDNQGQCYENVGIPVDYELNYPDDRQTFFRRVTDDLEGDKNSILVAIEKLRSE